MLSDIEIAQQAKLLPITEIANNLGIKEEELEPYGRYKAKLSDSLMERLADKPDGKLILVTAINPTPAGEGKTTTTAGLGQAMVTCGGVSLSELSLKTMEAKNHPGLYLAGEVLDIDGDTGGYNLQFAFASAAAAARALEKDTVGC